MAKPNNVHHCAISTADMKGQIAFFTDVLGMELVALYWMHGVPNTYHGFLKLNDQSSIAFVQSPEVGKIESEIGRTHSGNAGAASAPGTLQHVAFNVDTQEELLEMRDRIRSRGVHVLGHIDHGFCKSIYFAGPENLTLEISTSEGKSINAEAWIDPEVVALNGITAEELARYKSPAKFIRPATPLPQPAFTSECPRMAYPREIYEAIMGTPDDVIFSQASETTPPVKIAD